MGFRLNLAALAAPLLAMTVPGLAQETLTAPGPQGDLAGTLVRPAEGAPLLLILPGSGPTDRDGNNPLGVTSASYRLLAEALAERGIGTLRIDKRGMFASKPAVTDPNAVTIDDYVTDVGAWVASARTATGADCLWLVGHSEGGLVALAAAAKVDHLCGLVLLATPGRNMADLLRAQLRGNPANAPLLGDALSAVDALAKGDHVDVRAMHPALQGLFAPQVQDFLIDAMSHDPASLAAQTSLPMLIVQGGRDLQVKPQDDAEPLHAAQPASRYVLLPKMNHVLKDIASDNPAANLAAYGDSSLPLAAGLVDAIAAFVTRADPE